MDGGRRRYWLGTEETNPDLIAVGPVLQDGLRVVLCMSDMEVEATLEFDPKENCWVGHPIWSTVKDIGGSA